MWMMSNSRVESRLVAAGIALVIAACTSIGTSGATAGPESPRPPRDTRSAAASGGSGLQPLTVQAVELASVRIGFLRSDTSSRRLASAEFSRQWPNAVAVEVTTVQPLGNLQRTASPEIYLDSVRVGDTWAIPPNRLIVFVTDPQRLRPGVAISVAWLGDEERTRSRRPLVLTEEHLRSIR